MGKNGIVNALLDIFSRPEVKGLAEAYGQQMVGQEQAGRRTGQMAIDGGKGIVNALMEAGRIPGDVYAGDRPANVESAMPLLGLMAGGNMVSAPLRSGVSLGMFGGRLAKTADHAALARAEDMARRGASREQIWDDTGWFQGQDGKWRFEIDDSASALAGTGREREGALSEILDHPELHAAYPDLAQTPSYWNRGFAEELGFFYPSDDVLPGELRIAAYGRNDDTARNVLLHETQHGVQEIEGFAPGSPGSPRKRPGEWEARAVEFRRDLSRDQRRSRYPWFDYGLRPHEVAD